MPKPEGAMLWKINLLAIFVILDGISTWIGLEKGVVVELNPLVQFLYEQGPWIYFGSRLLVIICVWFGLRYASNIRLAKVLIWVPLCLYFFVLINHIVGWIFIS
jgi:hypothetical protein